MWRLKVKVDFSLNYVPYLFLQMDLFLNLEHLSFSAGVTDAATVPSFYGRIGNPNPILVLLQQTLSCPSPLLSL